MGSFRSALGSYENGLTVLTEGAPPISWAYKLQLTGNILPHLIIKVYCSVIWRREVYCSIWSENSSQRGFVNICPRIHCLWWSG